MKQVKKIIAVMIFSIFHRSILLKAQDGGMHINNMEMPDSLNMEQEFMTDAVMKSSGSGNTVLIIVLVLLVIAVTAYFIMKKRGIRVHQE